MCFLGGCQCVRDAEGGPLFTSPRSSSSTAFSAVNPSESSPEEGTPPSPLGLLRFAFGFDFRLAFLCVSNYQHRLGRHLVQGALTLCLTAFSGADSSLPELTLMAFRFALLIVSYAQQLRKTSHLCKR